MTQVGYGNRLFVQYNVFKPRIASFFKKFLYDVLNKFCIQVYNTHATTMCFCETGPVGSMQESVLYFQ